jgi:hypothetical protein
MTCTPPTRDGRADPGADCGPRAVLPGLRTPRCRTAPGAQRPVRPRPRPGGRQEGAHTMPSADLTSTRAAQQPAADLEAPCLRSLPTVARGHQAGFQALAHPEAATRQASAPPGLTAAVAGPPATRPGGGCGATSPSRRARGRWPPGCRRTCMTPGDMARVTGPWRARLHRTSGAAPARSSQPQRLRVHRHPQHGQGSRVITARRISAEASQHDADLLAGR